MIQKMNKFAAALSLCLPLLYSNMSFAENRTMIPEQKFLVGTWSGMPETAKLSKDFASQGVYTVKLNSDGTMLPLSELKMKDPSWITFSKDYKFAYITNEMEEGTVTAVAVGKDGQLKEINHVKSLGDHPTHSALSVDGKFLAVANYSVGPNKSGVSVLPILANGGLGEVAQYIKFLDGSGVIEGRQDSGHAHSVTFTPDGKTLYVADLGADVVKAYDYQPNEKQPLRANTALDLHFAKGSGPRHMVFSANGKFAYVTTEMSAEVIVFERIGKKFIQVQKQSLAVKDHESHKSASGLIFSPDNKFLYVGNRKEVNEIISYKVDGVSGKLSLVGRYTSGGVEPRAFSMDKTGEYLLISNVHSHTVSEFKRNKETGALTPTRIALQIGQPTDIKFFE